MYRPFDELFVASQLKLTADSENHKEYSDKKVGRCKYTLAKTKPVFD